jgi:histidinol-phosphatase (PHP family)
MNAHKRINPADIIGDERKYNFHSHTQFCDGRATMDAFAKAAVAAGFKYYGFTPHSPIPIESSCNMAAESVDDFIDEYNRICSVYGKDCQFFLGMEVDYLGPFWGPSHEFFSQLPLDYIIGSVHFVPNREGKMVDIDGRFEHFKGRMEEDFDNDIEYVVNTFFDRTEDMIKAGGFEVLGHFDKIAQNATYFKPGIEDEPWFQQRVNQLIDLIIEHDLTVEINTKARREHRRIFPAERHLPRLLKAGIKIIVNSDAHYTELIDASRDYAFELIDSLNSLR